MADKTLVRTLKLAVVQWIVLLCLNALNLDGGRLFNVTLIAALAYCAGVALLVANRGSRPASRWQRVGLLLLPVPLIVCGMLIAQLRD